MASSLAPSSANPGSLHGDVSGSGGSTGMQTDRHPAAPSSRAASRGRQRHPVRQRSVSRVATEPRSWTSLLASGGERQTPLDLSFVEPVMRGDAKTAIYDVSTSAEIVEAWQYAVIGYCVGLKPSYTTLSQFLQRAWRPKGHVDVLMREGGLFVCVFNLEEDMHAAIEGFWALRGHPLILRKWSPDLEMEKERLTSIPVWVRFPSLPLAWWSARGLSQISSLIGQPLRMDQLTASRKRLQYARVCILIEVGNDMPRSVTVINSKGTSEEISVQYEWIPKVCHHCNLFGHDAFECLRKSNTERRDNSAGSGPANPTLSRPVRRDEGGSRADPPRMVAPKNKPERRATAGGVPGGRGRRSIPTAESSTVLAATSTGGPRGPADFGAKSIGVTHGPSNAATALTAGLNCTAGASTSRPAVFGDFVEPSFGATQGPPHVDTENNIGDGDKEASYLLTNSSMLLLRSSNNTHSIAAFVLGMLDPWLVTPWQSLSVWFKAADSPSPFHLSHGMSCWEAVSQTPELNAMFNEAMASDTRLTMDAAIKEHGEVFREVKFLVDVGGGNGATAMALAKAFPNLKCTVLDLPHVIATVSAGSSSSSSENIVEFMAGDMFEYIPPADAILLKWILHDWGDDDCVKLLKVCKKAIPPKQEGGKLIIVDMVMSNELDPHELAETQCRFDLMMMVLNNGGRERSEMEWQKLFSDASFSGGYKMISGLDLLTIIEVYH